MPRDFFILKNIFTAAVLNSPHRTNNITTTTAAMAIAAPSVSLSAPYSIFPLSQPLRAKDREDGTYRACFTSSVESTKKRKRAGAAEIVVAVDGEGVNIYDVWQLTFLPALQKERKKKKINIPRSALRKQSRPTHSPPPRNSLAPPLRALLVLRKNHPPSPAAPTPLSLRPRSSCSAGRNMASPAATTKPRP